MVAVANAQIGATQSELGYTEAWCDNFVSDCAILAGQETAVPQGGGVGDFLQKILNAGGNYVSSPQAGDIVIFYAGKTAAHAALMVDSSNCVNGNYWTYGQSQVLKWSYSQVSSWDGRTYTFVRPNYTRIATQYNFDVNVYADGEYYAYGHDNVTFDVYLNDSRVADDVSDFSRNCPEGTTYKVDDICVSGNYLNKGNKSYSGTMNDNVNIILELITCTAFSDDNYRLKNNATGKYLTADGTYLNTTDVIVNDLDEYADNQIWNFILDSMGYKLHSCYNWELLNAYGDYAQDGDNVTLLRFIVGDGAQRWTFQKVSGGYVVRTVLSPNNVLTAVGNNVQIKAYTGASTQIWTIEPYTEPVAKYSLDVNLTVDGTAYNGGIDEVTYDVYIADENRTSNDVHDFYETFKKGTAFEVRDIKVSGCYKNNGSSSYAGTITDDTVITIPIVTSHSWNTGSVTKAATCKATGVKTYTCTRCGATKTATIAIAAGKHTDTNRDGVCDTCGAKMFSITTQPQSITSVIGGKATFKVAANGTGLTYQWQKSTNGGNTWANLSGYTKASFTITLRADHNNVRYRCIVTDANGAKSYSAAAAVTIDMAITSQPQSATGKIGDKKTFQVTASGVGLTYQWQKSTDGGKTWANLSGYTKASFTIALRKDHNGVKYRCAVSDANGVKMYSGVASVTVCASITSQPQSVTGMVGGKATFKVAADGTGLTYQWQKSTDGGKTWTNLSGYTKASFSITLRNDHNGVKYRCVVTNSGGAKTYSNAASVTVGPVISAQPQSVNESIGKKATFKVTAAGVGIAYQWQKSTNGGKTWANLSGYTKAAFSITLRADHNNVKYRCAVTDASGAKKYSNAATVTIIPAITTQPKSQSGGTGARATFQVVATGVGLTYQWQKSTDVGKTWKDLAGYTKSAFTITLRLDHNGVRYRCVITDANGTKMYSDSAYVALQK